MLDSICRKYFDDYAKEQLVAAFIRSFKAFELLATTQDGPVVEAYCKAMAFAAEQHSKTQDLSETVMSEMRYFGVGGNALILELALEAGVEGALLHTSRKVSHPAGKIRMAATNDIRRAGWDIYLLIAGEAHRSAMHAQVPNEAFNRHLATVQELLEAYDSVMARYPRVHEEALAEASRRYGAQDERQNHILTDDKTENFIRKTLQDVVA